MRDDEDEEITAAIAALRHDAPAATSPATAPSSVDAVLPQVYHELRRIAHRQLRAERPGHTLSTTAVVHEAYLRLAEQRGASWGDRGQFFALAARTMRRILIDYARRHRAARRGGADGIAVPFDLLERSDSPELAVAERGEWLLALDEALARLAERDARLARVVECRFFGGLTEDETAEALGVSPRTVSRDWMMARAWLHQELSDDGS
ncbi:MAG TPA: ECF-type sigma factor [Gemmatimonadaceae bacterium]|jgi:RNA polymerase sigma factor (TIGR02999 family)|nr:ECF-type sigma factor [Gemmatimonadaceae bacterium]